MIFLLLLPVLAAGYFTSIHHPYFRLSSAREEGQRLYLRAVSLGFASLVIGAVLALACSVVLPDQMTIHVGDLPNGAKTDYVLSLTFIDWLAGALGDSGVFNKIDDRQSAWLLLLSGTCFVGAVLIVFGAYVRYGIKAKVFTSPLEVAKPPSDGNRGWMRRQLDWLTGAKKQIRLDITAELLEQSPLDRLLFKAQRMELPLQFWLANRKVIVGFVIECAEPFPTTGTNNEVTILPMFSGYQDEKDLQVEFTTQYWEKDQQVEQIIRQDEIVKVGQFDWSAYEALKKTELSAKAET